MILLTRSLQKAKLNFRGVTPTILLLHIIKPKLLAANSCTFLQIQNFGMISVGNVHRFAGKILLSNFNEEVIERKISMH